MNISVSISINNMPVTLDQLTTLLLSLDREEKKIELPPIPKKEEKKALPEKPAPAEKPESKKEEEPAAVKSKQLTATQIMHLMTDVRHCVETKELRRKYEIPAGSVSYYRKKALDLPQSMRDEIIKMKEGGLGFDRIADLLDASYQWVEANWAELIKPEGSK